VRLATTKRRYFHGTSAKYTDSIRRRGLLGAPPQRVWGHGQEAIPGYVYLTTDLNKAISYAMSATGRGHGYEWEDEGEKLLIAVVELDRDDPRIMADEDILRTVYSGLIQQRLLLPRQTRKVLSEIWNLANGKLPRGVRPNSREHLAALMKASPSFTRNLGDILKSYTTPGDPEDSYNVLPPPGSGEQPDRRLVKNFTRSLRDNLTDMLGQVALSNFVPPERTLAFIASDWLEEYERTTGGRAGAWMKYRHKWERDWPEWFGPEAGATGQADPTVAVKADNLHPDELWVIPDEYLSKIRRYNDMMGYGTKVAAQKEPTMTELDQSIQRLAHMKAGALGRVPDTKL